MKFYKHVNSFLGKIFISPARWKTAEERFVMSANKVIVVTKHAKKELLSRVNINEQKVIQTDLNQYAEFSIKLSNEFPFLYGAFAIIAAIGLGILAAVVRKIISDLRKKKPKEEVKFPVK